MSEIKVDTLTGKTTANDITVTVGATATMSLEQGLAKSWVLGSSAAALTDSFNTSSGTDNGTGNYTYTFTSAMSSENFSSHATGAQNGRRYGFSATRTSTTNNVKFYDDNELAADCANGSALHGDLA